MCSTVQGLERVQRLVLVYRLPEHDKKSRGNEEYMQRKNELLRK